MYNPYIYIINIIERSRIINTKIPSVTQELNFPIGSRDPIDLSGHRWNLPIHIIEGAALETMVDWM